MMKKLIMITACAVVSVGTAWAASGSRDVYTDGGISMRSVDPYTDGGKTTRFDVYSDGASIVDKRDQFTDGA